MGSANIKASVSPVVPAGTPSPLRLASPQQIRSSTATGILSNTTLSSLALDLNNVMQAVNALHTSAQQQQPINQILLTNAAGQVVAAFGPTVYQGVQYLNFLSEVHVGDFTLSGDPTKAVFNANTDGSVSIGNNGWIDVHDPFGGNAAWIGTQNDTLLITNAVNNGSGAIRLSVPAHTFSMAGNVGAQVRNMNLYNVPNAVGVWPVAYIDANTVDLVGSVWSGPFTPPTPAAGIPTYKPTIDRILQIANVTSDGGLIQVTTTVPHGYDSGSTVNIPAEPGGIIGAVGQWIIRVINSTAFDLKTNAITGLPSVFAGAYTGGGTVLEYFAGILAQTIAIGSSFANFSLREFADGSLIIRNATIRLDAGPNSIVLDPAGPSIVLTSPTSVITLDASTGEITLAASGSLAKIVMTAGVPSIVLFNSAGTETASLTAETGVITGNIAPTGGFSGTALLSPPALTPNLVFVSGICTAYNP